MAETIKVAYCTNCAHSNIEHDFQDQTYGKFNRAFNISDKTGIAVCTVCGNGKKSKK